MRDLINPNHKIVVGSFSFSPDTGVNETPTCRLMGDVKVSPGKTMSQYVKEAFEKELYQAGLLDNRSPVNIQGSIEKLDFSSIAPANWYLTIRLESSNGAGVTVSNLYQFDTSFSAYGACHNVPMPLVPPCRRLSPKQ